MTSYDPEGGTKRSWVRWLVLAILALAGAALAWVFWFAGGTGEPTAELTIPGVTTATASEDITGVDTTVSDPTATTDPASTAPLAFLIEPGESVATFEIDEILRGEPTRVVGTTDQVAGQVVVHPDDLVLTTISEIVINARTFTTDSSQRDRAIRGPVILNSATDQHELIIFSPTGIEGLEGQGPAVAGETYEFTVIGELTIRDSTEQIAFEVVVDMVDEGTLRGRATTLVRRSDFGIGIPNVAFVADVSDEVALSLEFVAVAG